MDNVRINNQKVIIFEPNKLEKYVEDCINDAVERLKNHNLVKENPLKYVIKTLVGYDQAHDPEWQPYARYAKHNLADTETALNFIKEYYKEFKEAVEEMADDMGSADFYSFIFKDDFDLVRLTVTIYTEIAHKIGRITEILE